MVSVDVKHHVYFLPSGAGGGDCVAGPSDRKGCECCIHNYSLYIIVSFWCWPPSLIGHLASVDVKQHESAGHSDREGCEFCTYYYSLYSCLLWMQVVVIVQELCESRGGRPGLSVLTSLLVSVDVKMY